MVLPHVGTLELQQEEPQFNVVDKQMLPPAYRLSLSGGTQLPPHQLRYLAKAGKADQQQVLADLDELGGRIAHAARAESFSWNGLGTFRATATGLTLDAAPFPVNGLGMVEARKPLRENVSHSMLVGNNQMTSQEVTDSLEKGRRKRNLVMIIGWVLLVLALALIGFFLYKGGWGPMSSGLRLKATSLNY